MTTDTVQPKKKRGPESDEYNTLKGTMVVLTWAAGGETHRCRLRWVDQFTLGVTNEDGQPLIVYKHALACVGPDRWYGQTG